MADVDRRTPPFRLAAAAVAATLVIAFAVGVMVTVPFVLPTVVVAGAFLATGERLGLDEGAFALDGTVFAIIVAHVFFKHSNIEGSLHSFRMRIFSNQQTTSLLQEENCIR